MLHLHPLTQSSRNIFNNPGRVSLPIKSNLYTMRLKITLETIEEFNEIRSLLDKASVASYPAYSMDEKSLQWHNPTLVAVGTPNAISHVEHYVLKGRNVKMEEEKGY